MVFIAACQEQLSLGAIFILVVHVRTAQLRFMAEIAPLRGSSTLGRTPAPGASGRKGMRKYPHLFRDSCLPGSQGSFLTTV
jgi:hypothetical protein